MNNVTFIHRDLLSRADNFAEKCLALIIHFPLRFFWKPSNLSIESDRLFGWAKNAFLNPGLTSSLEVSVLLWQLRLLGGFFLVVWAYFGGVCCLNLGPWTGMGVSALIDSCLCPFWSIFEPWQANWVKGELKSQFPASWPLCNCWLLGVRRRFGYRKWWGWHRW